MESLTFLSEPHIEALDPDPTTATSITGNKLIPNKNKKKKEMTEMIVDLKAPMTVVNPREVPEYELNPLELQVRKSDGITKGSYQVAKWNGTKVSVKILDKDCYTDPESMYVLSSPENCLGDVGDLGSYLQKKARLSPSKALRFALDIARHDLNYNLSSFILRLYVAPEIYKDEIFTRSVDAYSFGLILYEMVEGLQPFHPKPMEEAAKLMCLEGKRPQLSKTCLSFLGTSIICLSSKGS
ncbi:hypothetical protein C1H46_011794 [Malus baccata]|uniref:Serine-threonine/tyrosine-protein kinase catalytic domain-containing protein n=1 Tax=Malus baccata TaxID=106549 RepID=A0A540MW31_MALBA|nr:hypothetical protein C1H46_011794 [Malus baccata]